jgi:arsenite methyltransferase
MLNLYESPVLRDITKPVIRPGGFELTDRGVTCCGLVENTRVLDIGCGTGAAVDYLRRRHNLNAMGIDLSAVLLQEGARTHRGTPLMRGRAEQLPVSGACFGAVLCECMLSLCANPHHVLQEMWRVVMPGGYMIQTDLYSREPAAFGSTGAHSIRCCLQRAVDRATVEARVAAAGFEQILWEDHTALLRQLAAQLVWNYGSLDAFWAAVAGPDAAQSLQQGQGGGCRRPGYYLLVARKIA